MNCIQGGKINIGDCAANVTDVSLKVVQNLDTVNPREMQDPKIYYKNMIYDKTQQIIHHEAMNFY